ncbi:MAG: AAA family ATPase, partial [Candidatus Izemoplasmataceae bacterium]
MLQYLSVKNFAILENIEVTFSEGFTALTGETGAGKSLLIDAIGLLLGDRANTDVVRTGEDVCEIKGLFVNLSDKVMEVLNSLDISAPDKECLIIRQISKNSANTVKVNRQTITLQDLRLITEHLADIHTQHDTKRLINPETYLSLIDGFDQSTLPLIHDYQAKLKKYKEVLNSYNSLLNDKESTLEKLEFMRFQYEELTRHQLVHGEEDSIKSQLKALENFDAIYQGISKSIALFEAKEISETLYDIQTSIESIKGYNELYQELSNRLSQVYYELDDILSTLVKHSETLDFDPIELEHYQNREHTLETLKRKYHKNIDELIDFTETLRRDLETYENYDDAINASKKRVIETFNQVKEAALKLTKKRESTAKIIEKNLLELLSDLELQQAVFEIRFDQSNLSDAFNHKPFKHDGV